MELTGKIVFNELASYQSVMLPGVGTLWVEHEPARQVDDHGISPPFNAVRYSPEPHNGARSVVELMEAGGMAREDAERGYAQWRERARTTTGIDVGEAGRIENGKFIPSQELDAILNPYGVDGGIVRKKGLTRGERIWIVLIIAFLLILTGGWYWWYNSGRDGAPAAADTEVRRQPAPAAVPERIGGPPAVGIVIADDGDDAETQAAPQGPEPASQATEAVPVAAAPAGIRYYVVGGVFSSSENADRYIAGMKRDYPDLDYGKTDYRNGLVLVSLFSAADGKEAADMRNKLAVRTYNSELWVYKSDK